MSESKLPFESLVTRVSKHITSPEQTGTCVHLGSDESRFLGNKAELTR